MIASLVMLVVAYSVSHRLFEFAWKGQLRTLFPSALAYQARTDEPACSKPQLHLWLTCLMRTSEYTQGWPMPRAPELNTWGGWGHSKLEQHFTCQVW